MLKHVARDIGIGGALVLAVWLCLFAWSVVRTIYEDHQSLVAENQRLRNMPEKVKIQYATPEQPKESPNSLRRRTLKLCADLDAFLEKRQEVWQQTPRRQDDATNQQYKDWAIETYNLYASSDLRQRTLEIIRQLELKGLDVGLVGAEFGAARRVPDFSEIAHLRDLAHYLDANGNVTHF